MLTLHSFIAATELLIVAAELVASQHLQDTLILGQSDFRLAVSSSF